MTESVQAWRLSRDVREYVAEARTLAKQAGLDATTSPNLMATLDWASSYAERSDAMHALSDPAASDAMVDSSCVARRFQTRP